MKKIVLLIWVVLFSFAMIACEGDITLPSGVTLPDITTDHLTGLETTVEEELTSGQVMTTEEDRTAIPTSNQGTTDIPKTVVPTTESPTITHTEENTVTTEIPTTTEEVTTTEAVTTEEVTTEDPSAEVAGMLNLMDSMEMDIIDSEAFVTEMYAKGMRSADLINMMTNLASIDTITPDMSMIESYQVIDGMMENMDRTSVEALVSALVKVQLRDMLQMQLDMTTLSQLSLSPVSRDEVDGVMLEKLIQAIDENGDDIVASAMIALNYVMDVQSVFDPTYISGLEGLMGKESFNTLDYLLMITIKNGVLGYMKDELPTVNEFVLLNSTVIAFLSILSDDLIDFSLLNVQAQATQQHMSIELMFDFLISIDEGYVQSLMEVSEEYVDKSYVKAFLHENVDLIDQFLDDHAYELNALQEVVDYQDKEDLFFDFYIDELLVFALGSSNMDPLQMSQFVDLIHQVIHYDSIDAMPGLMSGVLNDLLDELVASDYEFIDRMVDALDLSPEYFDDFQAYIEAENLTSIEAAFALVDLLQPVIEGLDSDEYEAVLDIFVMVINMVSNNEIDTLLIDLDMSSQQSMMALNLLFDFLASRDESFELALKDFVMNSQDPAYAKDLILEVLLHIDSFYNDYENEIDDLMNLSSVEDRSEFFHDFLIDEVLVFILTMDGMEETMIEDLVETLHEHINYEAIDHLPGVYGRAFEDIIHQLVESDFEVIDIVMDMMTLDSQGLMTWEEYQIESNKLMVDFVLSIVDLVGPVVQSMSVEDYQAFIDTAVSGLSLVIDFADLGQIDFTLMEIDLISETQMRTMNLMFDFLMLRDADYEMALDAMIETPEDLVVVRAFIVENIELIDAFLTTYHLEIEELNNVSTFEERYNFFHDFLIDQVLAFILNSQALPQNEIDDFIDMAHELINYEAIDAMPGLLTGMLEALLDELMLSNFEFIDHLIYSSGLSPFDFSEYDDYMVAVESANMTVLLSFIDLLAPVIQNVSAEEYEYVMTIGINFLSAVTEGEVTLSGLDTALVSQADKMMVDLFLELLISRDIDYDNSIYALISNPDDPASIKDFIAENIGLLDQFIDDNQTEIEAVLELSTFDDREAFVMDFLIGDILSLMLIQDMDEMVANQVVTYIQMNLDWQMIESLAYVLQNMANNLIDELVLSDYELIEYIIIVNSLDPMDFLTEEEYYDISDYTEYLVLLSALDLLDPIVQDLTLNEYQSMIDAGFMVMNMVLGLEEITEASDITDELAALVALEAAIDNSAANQLAMIKAILAYEDLTATLDDIYITMDADDIPQQEKDYMLGYFVSTMITDVYDSISGDLAVITSEATSLLSDTIFLEVADIDPADASEMIDFLTNGVPAIVSLADDIVAFDIDDLSYQEILVVIDFLELLGYEVETAPIPLF